jgi:hypothetical protein
MHIRQSIMTLLLIRRSIDESVLATIPNELMFLIFECLQPISRIAVNGSERDALDSLDGEMDIPSCMFNCTVQ